MAIKDAMLKDEIAILKAVMMQVDDNTAMLVTLQYHTEKNPDTGKLDRSKSYYRWLARVFKLDDLKAKIKWCMQDENALAKFKWPGDTSPWWICAANDSNNKTIGKWLNTKLKKLKTWNDGQLALKGWQSKTAKREAGYNEAAKYETEGYLTESGSTISLTDQKAILENVGKNLIYVCQMKSKMAKTTAA